MSLEIYKTPQLRIYDERELKRREHAQNILVDMVENGLSNVNKAWNFSRIESSMMMPISDMSSAYTDEDIWKLSSEIKEPYALRAETTSGTYSSIRALYPNKKQLKLPHCFWQVGKSFRKEPASKASRLRFYEFTQLEFQCLYAEGTLVNYRDRIIDELAETIGWLCKSEYRIIESDRLPDYSNSTMDIEVKHGAEWREIASISDRTDFECPNLEIAIGLDRIISI